MIIAECTVTTQYKYLCLQTQPCSFLMNIEMRMSFDKIFIDIVFTENVIKVECGVATWYGHGLHHLIPC